MAEDHRLVGRGFDDAAHVRLDPADLIGARDRDELRDDIRREAPLIVDFLELLERVRVLDRALEARGEQCDVRQRRADLVRHKRGDLGHRGAPLRFQEPLLVRFVRGHVSRDHLHVRVDAVLPDHARPDLHEALRAVLSLHERLKRLGDRFVMEESPQVGPGPLELPRR